MGEDWFGGGQSSIGVCLVVFVYGRLVAGVLGSEYTSAGSAGMGDICGSVGRLRTGPNTEVAREECTHAPWDDVFFPAAVACHLSRPGMEARGLYWQGASPGEVAVISGRAQERASQGWFVRLWSTVWNRQNSVKHNDELSTHALCRAEMSNSQPITDPWQRRMGVLSWEGHGVCRDSQSGIVEAWNGNEVSWFGRVSPRGSVCHFGQWASVPGGRVVCEALIDSF